MKRSLPALLLAALLFFTMLPTASAAEATGQELYELLLDTQELIRTEGLESTSTDQPLAWALADLLDPVPTLEQLPALLESQPELFDLLMDAMLSGYDRHSRYLPAGTYSAAYEPESNYMGVGLTIQAHNRGALVADINLMGSAAAQGIRVGDVLTQIEQQPLKGMSIDQIAQLLRGEEGTFVTVTVLRSGQTLSFTLQRTWLSQMCFSGALIDDDVYYMKWSRIDNDGSYLLFRLQLMQMQQAGCDNLILDLRDNPGGNLSLSFLIASDLMEETGPFFRIAQRNPYQEDGLLYRFINAEGDGVDIPNIFVLVNENSASAAEVIAVSLRDKEHATLIGQTTYGKGRAQQHRLLDNDAGIVLTTMKLLPLDEVDYEGVGITPQIEVENKLRRQRTGLLVPTDVALSPYSCSDNCETLNRALVALGLLDALPEKTYQLGEDSIYALNRLETLYQITDNCKGAGIPTLLLVNRLLEQLQAGQYVVDVQLNTALELAHNVQTAD